MKLKKGTIAMTFGLLLLAAAFCLAGYNLWDDRRAFASSASVMEELGSALQEAREQEEKTEQEESLEQGEQELPCYVRYPEMEMPVLEMDGHYYIGKVEIPSLALCLPVMAEWSDSLLKIAPCRYAGSAYLNNLVIAGHNYKAHFSRIKQLRAGDAVIFTDADSNQFDYQVDSLEILDQTDVEEMEEGSWDLTLFTCTYGGRSRCAVRCRRGRQ